MKVISKQYSQRKPADIRSVRITDPFFAPFIEKIRTVTVPDVFAKFLADGAIENYRRVARGEHGGHAGPPWYHGLIGEVIRGVSDLLAVRYDPLLDRQLDEIVEAIAAAQGEDGWLHPYVTLERPQQLWGLNGGNARWQHETYDAGCLIEAGVHHARATGKTTLLSCSVKCANYLTKHIGPAPKWNIVCEHSLAESALISLEALFNEDPALAAELGAHRGEYLALAKFFIDHKGDHENRHQFPPFLREYAQDHRPGREQREAVGHAVRATLFYTGIAEAAAASDDEGLETAARAIWKDIAETKLHINGSVGAFRDDERFGQQYELPNDAYLETCAGVGLLFFAAAMFRLTGEASVWDVAENTITNLLPAAVSEDGTHYTYENPLESRGGRERWSWHSCPCCPPMLLKAVGELPSCLFSGMEDDLWMNLYIDAEAELEDAKLRLEPDGSGKRLTVTCGDPKTVHIRIPSWAKDFALSLPYRTEKGYAVVNIPAGVAEIGITCRCEPVKIEAHPWVGADRGRIAVRCGPVLYCAEKTVETWDDLDPVLSKDPPVRNADGTVTVKTSDGDALTLIEYRRWNNRGPLPMRVWFRQEGCTSDPCDLSGWERTLYREWTPGSGE